MTRRGLGFAIGAAMLVAAALMLGSLLGAGGSGTTQPSKPASAPREAFAGIRNLWVTQTALATALNMSYMAEQLALFGIVVGVALLLSGIGFVVLTLGGALRIRMT